MSVLNPNSDEEPLECPLCMEFLELDDVNFYPCSCCYQICRFCWNKIRTEGSGLCPACRSPYAENPADFKPLTAEEMAKIKLEKRQKDQAKKQKISENRKHLANVRVVQKNLVFVVGLSPRLADPEVLRRQEYFGKFGKMHKVVINLSTAYAGNQNQGPSASAYVTYYRSDDALRAIQAVSNIYIDGRTLKASLGTTKYCSHFMKNQPCPKPDCMYLHELGDEAASFTKEEMQQGKHTDYERMLHEEMLEKDQNQQNGDAGGGFDGEQQTKKAAVAKTGENGGVTTTSRTPSPKCPVAATTTSGSVSSSSNESSNTSISSCNSSTAVVPTAAWSSMNGGGGKNEVGSDANNADDNSITNREMSQNLRNKATSSSVVANTLENLILHSESDSPRNTGNAWESVEKEDIFAEDDLGFDPFHETQKALAEMLKSESSSHSNSTGFYGGGGGHINNSFSNHNNFLSSTASTSASSIANNTVATASSSSNSSRLKQPPPGFANMMNPFSNSQQQHFSDVHNFHGFEGGFGNHDFGYGGSSRNHRSSGGNSSQNGMDQLQHQFRQMGFDNKQQNNFSNSKDWQDGFRALLPNVNVSFGALPHQQQQHQQHHLLEGVFDSAAVTSSSSTSNSRFNNLSTNQVLNEQHNNIRHNSGWIGSNGVGINDWTVLDPAIVGGQLSDHQHHQHIRSESPSNWIKANLDQLTSDNASPGFNMGPLLQQPSGSSFNNFLSSAPTSIPQSSAAAGANGSSVGLAGWTQPLLANTPPPGFSLNRTAAQLHHGGGGHARGGAGHLFSQGPQGPGNSPMANPGLNAGTSAADQLESEFQRLIHSK